MNPNPYESPIIVAELVEKPPVRRNSGLGAVILLFVLTSGLIVWAVFVICAGHTALCYPDVISIGIFSVCVLVLVAHIVAMIATTSRASA